MSITEQELAAYADGELSGDDAARVEQAVAADPSLAAKVDRHRALRATLSAHFAPVADQPLPDRLTALLQQDDKVVQLAPLRDARRTGARLPRWSWIAAPALAASLALALFLPRGDGTTAYADPQLAATLDGQLVAQQASNAETRILLSFARDDGDYCRAYVSPDQSGIACRDAQGWALVERFGGVPVSGGEYQQAGSPLADLMAKAQDMAANGALDAQQEQAARAQGWRE
jgi:anti-sigma-K factor RskA